MIKADLNDLKELKKLCPRGHLIIASSTYKGWRRVLELMATTIANPIQLLKKRKYNNKDYYIGHLFVIYYKNKSLWVGEMDWKKNWSESPITESNTFKKLYDGQIRIFDLGAIPKDEFKSFLTYAKTVRYTYIGALASEIFFLKIFRSEKNLSRKRHCGSIFVRYQPFFKYFKTTGNELLKEFGTHHPEAIDYYLKNNFDLKIVKINEGKIIWNKKS